MVPHGVVFRVLVQKLGGKSEDLDRVLSFCNLRTQDSQWRICTAWIRTHLRIDEVY
jgi:hypothetical protein